MQISGCLYHYWRKYGTIEIPSIARQKAEPIRRAQRELLELAKEYEITEYMTDREYTLYLSQPKIGVIPPADLIF